jgi:hypothetical protein
VFEIRKSRVDLLDGIPDAVFAGLGVGHRFEVELIAVEIQVHELSAFLAITSRTG